jgi:Zn finger protein HypA/HybF involved in hydrogenase expression
VNHEIPVTCPKCGTEYDARLHWWICPVCGIDIVMVADAESVTPK